MAFVGTRFGGASHVAGCARDEPGDVVLLDRRQHLLLGDVIGVTRWQNSHDVAHRPKIHFLIEWKVVDLNPGARLGENGDVLDKILELTHVATPRARRQEVEGVLTERWYRFLSGAVASPENPQEVVCQEWDVIDSLAQRRNSYLHHVQPVIKVFTQRLAADGVAGVAAGCGHGA